MASAGLARTPQSGAESPREQIPRRFTVSPQESAAGVVLGVAALACVVHFAFSGQYGYFRDELYYAACGEHLAWGYVDQAPLIAVVARVTRALLGNSLFALRFLPTLSAGAKVLLTAWMVRELGGQRFAQILAAVCIFIAPIYLTFDSFLSMNAFEPLFWMGCAAIFMRLASSGNPRLWLLFGGVVGVGILNKHSMVFMVAGLLAGILLTPERRLLRSSWFWLGGLLALVIVFPNLLWEMREGWPTIQILRVVREIKNVQVTPLQFILEQTLLMHPLETPVWLIGLGYFFFAPQGRRYRALGWTYLFVLAQLLALKGKIYYLAPIYPMLVAAGAVQTDAWVRERGWRWLKPAILVPLAVGGIVAAPLALPILPVKLAVPYTDFWDVDGVKVERVPVAELPQFYGDQFGWQNQAAVVSRVYQSLPPADRAKCGILAWNYGQAGAIDYFGPAMGLPHAISGQNNYFLWGSRGYSGEVMIAVGVPLEKLQQEFGSIEQAATIVSPYAIPEETNLPVYICRQPKMPFGQAFPLFHYLG